MGHSLNQPLPAANPIYPSNYCNAELTAYHYQTETSPAGIPTGPASLLLSDIRPDACYGLSPIVHFKFLAEVRVFNPGLGSASSEARLGFGWRHFHKGTSC
jgi:hypothetical protein